MRHHRACRWRCCPSRSGSCSAAAPAIRARRATWRRSRPDVLRRRLRPARRGRARRVPGGAAVRRRAAVGDAAALGDVLRQPARSLLRQQLDADDHEGRRARPEQRAILITTLFQVGGTVGAIVHRPAGGSPPVVPRAGGGLPGRRRVCVFLIGESGTVVDVADRHRVRRRVRRDRRAERRQRDVRRGLSRPRAARPASAGRSASAGSARSSGRSWVAALVGTTPRLFLMAAVPLVSPRSRRWSLPLVRRAQLHMKIDIFNHLYPRRFFDAVHRRRRRRQGHGQAGREHPDHRRSRQAVPRDGRVRRLPPGADPAVAAARGRSPGRTARR